MELPAGAYMSGIPHTPGTREYLTCESGRVQLSVAGSSWELSPGDVVVSAETRNTVIATRQITRRSRIASWPSHL